MKDFKLGTFPINQPKSTRPKTRSFGYQVLGFGSGGPVFGGICATGGNSTVDVGIYKVHVFTGNGTFTVNSVGADDSALQYLVIGGGGSGSGAGGGAGGYRTSIDSTTVTATAQGYPIVVGAGGTASQCISSDTGTGGAASSALGISSAGGGKCPAFNVPTRNGQAGGSGGGGSGSPAASSGGAGNTPPVSPSQGNPGGNGAHGPPPGGFNNTGAGGGANAAGSTFVGGQGRNSHTPIFGSEPQPFYISNQPRCPVPGATDRFAGGGGGVRQQSTASPPASSSGDGGGGDAQAQSSPFPAVASGVANSGGGGGGTIDTNCRNGNGGSGVVLIAYKTAAA